jgi:hypothetical protein
MTFRNGYSAKVALTLKVNGRELEVSHVGLNEESLRAFAKAADPSDAQLVIRVDNSSNMLDVCLPNGVPSDSYEVDYR